MEESILDVGTPFTVKNNAYSSMTINVSTPQGCILRMLFKFIFLPFSVFRFCDATYVNFVQA